MTIYNLTLLTYAEEKPLLCYCVNISESMMAHAANLGVVFDPTMNMSSHVHIPEFLSLEHGQDLALY